MWQQQGMRVIPTISWWDGRSFYFCFDGVEDGAVVAVATVGSRDLRAGFMRGYQQMVRRIQPAAVVCYGQPFEEIAELAPVVVVPYAANQRVARRLPGEANGW